MKFIEEEVTITKNGEPVAMLVTYHEKQDEIFGFMKGKGRIVGDLVEPITPAEDWSDEIFPSHAQTEEKALIGIFSARGS